MLIKVRDRAQLIKYMKYLPNRSCAGSGAIRLVTTSVRYKTSGLVMVSPVAAFICRACLSLTKIAIVKSRWMLKLEIEDVSDLKTQIRVGPRSPGGFVCLRCQSRRRDTNWFWCFVIPFFLSDLCS